MRADLTQAQVADGAELRRPSLSEAINPDKNTGLRSRTWYRVFQVLRGQIARPEREAHLHSTGDWARVNQALLDLCGEVVEGRQIAAPTGALSPGVVNYLGRPADTALARLLLSPDSLTGALIIGAGGYGKTSLLLQISQRVLHRSPIFAQGIEVREETRGGPKAGPLATGAVLGALLGKIFGEVVPPFKGRSPASMAADFFAAKINEKGILLLLDDADKIVEEEGAVEELWSFLYLLFLRIKGAPRRSSLSHCSLVVSASSEERRETSFGRNSLIVSLAGFDTDRVVELARLLDMKISGEEAVRLSKEHGGRPDLIHLALFNKKFGT